MTNIELILDCEVTKVEKSDRVRALSERYDAGEVPRSMELIPGARIRIPRSSRVCEIGSH